MKYHRLRISRLIAGTALAITSISAVGADMPTVPRWHPHDFSFKATSHPDNPFTAQFAATVTGPSGQQFTLPGFFDGDGTWKVRVAPTTPGEWSLVTRSDVPELNGKTARFRCDVKTKPNVHGVLRVDREHPHHFIFEDGTRFYMQGYEYDWLWALDMDKPGVPTVEKSLEMLARYGFNYIILNSYAHDTKWCQGKTSADDYGPPLLYAWAGSNEQPDHTRLNLAFWQHYDRVITAMMERGFQAHMLIKVYNKQVKWPERDSAEEKLFFQTLVARYAAFPNVIWDFSKEAHNEKDVAYKQRCLKFFREQDPYRHLTTVHDDDAANDRGDYDELTDFRTDQQHSKFRETIMRQRQRRAWPVANVESDYECGPGGVQDKTYGQAHTTDQTLRTLWQIAMGGGYTAYYYTYTAWDVVRPLEVTPGYKLMKHFGDFWRGTQFWQLQPADDLVSAGWCLANPGREYVVYFNTGAPFTLDLKNASGKLKAEWFNPFTGKTKAAGSHGDGVVQFTPPADWGDAPVVLHVGRK